MHGPDCGCGHAHVPDARDLRGDWSLAKAFSLAFAVGIRPCTGAILVLVFANGMGLYWAGVFSTFAMACRHLHHRVADRRPRRLFEETRNPLCQPG